MSGESDTQGRRGPVCAECRHLSMRGDRWGADVRTVCRADRPVVISPGRFDHVSGRVVDRVEAEPPACADLNGEGQCTRFEPKPPPSRPAPNPTRSGGEARGSAPIVAKPRSGGGGEHDDGRSGSDILAAGFGAAVAALLLTAVTALVNCHAAQPSKAEQCREAAP